MKNEKMPKTFNLCLRAECPMAEKCLRHTAWEMLPTGIVYLSVINPKAIKLSTSCNYYCSNTPMRFARGFKGMQANMLPAQYEKFRAKLITRLSRNAYYERRRGERLCSPDEITYIRSVLKSLKLESLEFDAYEEHLYWKD